MAVAKKWRVCVKCTKPKLEFYGRQAKCKDCALAEMRERYHATKPEPKRRVRCTPEELKERRRNAAFLRRYGISTAQRDAMLAEQGGACAICRTTEPLGYGWATDHDHACCPTKDRSCGKCVRGILCSNCNTMLGHARDDGRVLTAAIEYLATRRVMTGAA